MSAFGVLPYLKNSLSSIKTEVATKFPKKLFFSDENQLGTERVNKQNIHEYLPSEIPSLILTNVIM